MRYCIPKITSNLLSVVQDSITGVLLAGIGQVGTNGKKNFVIVDASGLLSLILSR